MNFVDIPSTPRNAQEKAMNRSTVLTLRDVVDVEVYVFETIREAALPVRDEDLDELVRAGVESVRRVERALPPQWPLLPVLDTVLSPRLVELAGAAALQRSSPAPPTAIAA
jgi:hypothetical protein